MSGEELYQRMLLRNRAILAARKSSFNNKLPVVVDDVRPFLASVHNTNLRIDCVDQISSGQNENGTALQVRGAVVRPIESPASLICRMEIIKDHSSSVYLNFEVMRDKPKVVTLIELKRFHNPMSPLVIKDIPVLGYTQNHVDIAYVAGAEFKHNRYALMVQHRALTMPRCREYLNTLSLLEKPLDLMTPMVRAFALFVPGTKLVIPEPPGNIRQILGLDYCFQHKQAPPGAGKTHQLIRDAVVINSLPHQTCFILAPTNEVVLEICSRLSDKQIAHNVVLSDLGLSRRLTKYSNNVSLRAAVDSTENVNKRPSDHVAYSKAFSNIHVMTVNKSLTPKYERLGLYPTIIQWDEITLSTCGAFYGVLNKNPSYLITYGDEKQGVPFVPGDFAADDPTLSSPITTFKIPLTPYHKFMRRHVRMHGSYGELFLRFFYDSVTVGTVCDFPDLGNFVSINYDSGVVRSKLRRYSAPPKTGLYSGCGKSSIGNISSVNVDYLDRLFITPYLANAIHLKNLHFPPHCVHTFRPAQGQQCDKTYVDFVRDRASKFITNTQCVVALSRHVLHLQIGFVPRLPKREETIMAGFTFNDSDSISKNYNEFVSYYNYRLGCGGQYVHKNIEVTVVDNVAKWDVNNDFFLKWWFFLALVQRILNRNNCLPHLAVNHVSPLAYHVVPDAFHFLHMRRYDNTNGSIDDARIWT